MRCLLIAALPATLAAAGTVHVVQVGQSGLTFTPSALSAAVGDQVEFHFASPYHTVTRGTFDAPCNAKADGGFNSGLVTDTTGKPFTITIADEEPVYFYCAELGHCPAGMAGAINAPADASAADYISASKASTSDPGPPADVYGGEFAYATTVSAAESSSTIAVVVPSTSSETGAPTAEVPPVIAMPPTTEAYAGAAPSSSTSAPPVVMSMPSDTAAYAAPSTTAGGPATSAPPAPTTGAYAAPKTTAGASTAARNGTAIPTGAGGVDGASASLMPYTSAAVGRVGIAGGVLLACALGAVALL